MIITPYSNFLVNADNVCRYVPFVSTVSSLVDLFQKSVVMPFLDKATIAKSHYYTHLQQTSYKRLVTLLIPVIGQIAIAIYDFIAIKKGKAAFAKAEELMKTDSKEAMKHYEVAATYGLAEAMFIVGKAKVAVDQLLAVSYLAQAALAMQNLANMIALGNAYYRSENDGLKAYGKEVLQKHPMESLKLGLEYVDTSYEQAKPLLKVGSSMEKGREQIHNKAIVYLETKRMVNQKKGVKLLLINKKQNYAPSLYSLGVCHAGRLGKLKYDPEKIVAYYQSAADQNYPPALYYLGVRIVGGEGIEKNVELGKKYILQAAALGVVEAKNFAKELNWTK